jgi:cobalt-zinc-cadmium efflux system membrane fusion protein
MRYVDTEHKLQFAKEELDREAQLLEKGIASLQEYQSKKQQYTELDVSHTGALEQLKLLGFSEKYMHDLMENVQEQKVSTYEMKSPFSGEVISRNVTLGQTVNKDQELFRVADLSNLVFEAQVPIKYISFLKVAEPVEIFCKRQDLSATGTIKFISPVVDDQTRTVKIKVDVPNVDRKWIAGMTSAIRIKRQITNAEVVVPVESVHEIGDETVVFVKTEPDVFEIRHVDVGEKSEKNIEIVDGLFPGEEVASQNSFSLKAEWLNKKGD